MKILFFDLDTVRADHLGCYGYGRATSPNIDEIAGSGVRFDNYYCPNAPCLPSRASLVSGQYGIINGVVGHGGTAADMRLEGAGRGFHSAFSRNNLFLQFRKAGYHTASVSTFAEVVTEMSSGIQSPMSFMDSTHSVPSPNDISAPSDLTTLIVNGDMLISHLPGRRSAAS